MVGESFSIPLRIEAAESRRRTDDHPLKEEAMSGSPFGKLTAALATLALAGACTSSSRPTAGSATSPTPTSSLAPSPTGSSYQPAIDPANFVSVVDNPYMTWEPGTTYVYAGIKDGESQRDEVVVTEQTKLILGIPCVVVQDTATHQGTLLEKTEDWYTQDKEGNVWYFGEDTAEYEDGKVASREGSWQAGVDGAQPGIVMPAHPQVTDSFRQEYYQGHAEDTFWIVSLTQSVSVPYGRFSNALLSMEWTRLEPKVIDQKYYVPGIGVVLEASAAGDMERAELVSVTKP
jgi:hypothetical protein